MNVVNELTHPLDIFGVALLLLVISELSPVTVAIWIPLQKFRISFASGLCVVLRGKKRNFKHIYRVYLHLTLARFNSLLDQRTEEGTSIL